MPLTMQQRLSDASRTAWQDARNVYDPDHEQDSRKLWTLCFEEYLSGLDANELNQRERECLARMYADSYVDTALAMQEE